MNTAADVPPVVRVVRGGDIPDEELAALTAVLLARAGAAAEEPEGVAVVPLWERGASGGYRSPLSWRS